MEHQVVTELNAVLKGEEMAVEVYDRFIRDVNDDHIKGVFQEIQLDHKNHAMQIAARIRDLGGVPQHDTGMAGTMADVKIAIQDRMNNRDPMEILKKAYDGEDKGIAKVEEIIKGDLDKASDNLVKNIINADHQHLRVMAKLIADYELNG